MQSIVCPMFIPTLCFALLHGYVLLDNVSINGSGPYRFLVDTSSQSTSITPQLANALKLDPVYRVTLETSDGSKIVPASNVRIDVGSVQAEAVEVLWYDRPTHDALDGPIDGILGHNFLSRFDFVLDFKRRALAFAPPSAFAELLSGERIPLRLNEGRPLIPARFSSGGKPIDFFLDFGPQALFLPPELAGHARRGSIKKVFIGDTEFANVPAMVHQTPLLSASLFDSIYMNSESGYAVINPDLRFSSTCRGGL